MPTRQGCHLATTANTGGGGLLPGRALGRWGSIGSCGSCRCCRRPPRSCTPSAGRSPGRVTDECHWPPQARAVQVGSRSALPAAVEPAQIDRLASASVGGGQPLDRLDTAAIGDLRPDLVLAQDLCAVCAVPSGHLTQALDLLGGQAEVSSLDPSSLDEVLEGMLQVGQAARVQPRAEEVVAGLRQRLARSRPGSRGGSGPGCWPWSGAIPRSTAGTGCRRRWRPPGRSRARRPGCPLGAGALDPDPGGGAPGGGVPALRLRACEQPSRRRDGRCYSGPSWPGSRRSRRRRQRLLVSSGPTAGRRGGAPRRGAPPRMAAPTTGGHRRAPRAKTAPVTP